MVATALDYLLHHTVIPLTGSFSFPVLSDYHERIDDNELNATNQKAARSRVYGDQLRVFCLDWKGHGVAQLLFHEFWGASVRDLVLFVTKAVDPKIT